MNKLTILIAGVLVVILLLFAMLQFPKTEDVATITTTPISGEKVKCPARAVVCLHTQTRVYLKTCLPLYDTVEYSEIFPSSVDASFHDPNELWIIQPVN